MTRIPQDLTDWSKKYGPGFVMYSLTNGEVVAADKNFKKLEKKAEKKKVNRQKVSVIYVPDEKTFLVV